jgi:hypothetical protein
VARAKKTDRERRLAVKQYLDKTLDPLWKRIVAEEYQVASRRAEQRYREAKQQEVARHAAP